MYPCFVSTVVTVLPLLSQLEWKVELLAPSVESGREESGFCLRHFPRAIDEAGPHDNGFDDGTVKVGGRRYHKQSKHLELVLEKAAVLRRNAWRGGRVVHRQDGHFVQVVHDGAKRHGVDVQEDAPLVVLLQYPVPAPAE